MCEVISIINFKGSKCDLCLNKCPRQDLITEDCSNKSIIKNLLQGILENEKTADEIFEEFNKMEEIFQKGENEIERYLRKLRMNNQNRELDKMTEYLEQKAKFIKPNYNGPIQLILLEPDSEEYQNKRLLIAADCAPFVELEKNIDTNEKDTAVILFCPQKTNAHETYVDKLAQIFKRNKIKSIIIMQTETDCCSEMATIVKRALKQAERIMPKQDLIITNSEKN